MSLLTFTFPVAMLLSFNKLHFLRFISFSIYIIFTSFVAFNNAAHRNLSYFVNPGCKLAECKPTEGNSTYLNLVHIKAVGENDTVHYLWSTYKIPSIIIAKTSHSASLAIDWKGLLEFQEHSISFSETPLHSISLLIKELWQFDDENDEVNMYSANNVTSLGMSKFYWDDINGTLQFTETLITTSPESRSNDTAFSNNGIFKIQFSVSAEDTPSSDYPHLWFTSNSSQLNLFLIGLNPLHKKSRFAAEVVSLSSPVDDDEWKRTFSITIDDEYSPGVFKVYHMYSPCSDKNSNCKSFVMWKPVAYIGEKATVANSSDATASDYTVNDVGVSESIATSYFGSGTNVSQIAWNMTFGTTGDGFYTKTKYTSWSVMVGIGEPIMDKMSLLAIVVTSVGLGAPLLMMLGGVSFLGYKKYQQKDDDLLLEG